MPMAHSEIMCLMSRGKWKMLLWRCLISWLIQLGPYQWGHAVWILLPLVKRSFYTTLFLERTLDFPLAQHIGKELDMEGGASFFWRGRGKIVLHTLEGDCWSEDDDVWECSNRTLIKSYGVNQFFACISGHPQKKAALTWDCLDLLFKQDSGYINQTKFIIRVGLAHCNNKPFSSNTSLACHNYCNHIFPEVQTLVNVCLRNPQLYD